MSGHGPWLAHGWEGNRRSGVALAMRHRFRWFVHLRARGLRKGDEHPACNSPHGDHGWPWDRSRLEVLFHTDGRGGAWPGAMLLLRLAVRRERSSSHHAALESVSNGTPSIQHFCATGICHHTHTHTHTRLTALCPGLPR